MIEPYKVYVKTDEQNRITAINSSAFLSSLDGWVEIDSGRGDKYHHAQGNYFNKPIMDDHDIWRYKLVDGRPVERTQEEMDADYTPYTPTKDPKDLKIEQLEQQVASLSAAFLQL